ncbi:UPF0481 protein [Senna tora]|uniref:UPF0481 protein n=1 Tax=Senna tora TaxID=362788 RepID=A0A834WAA0_9FABA|nr:UPF0481 protein [Senna tora]
MNKRAYKPQTVSFGPYRHGKENVKGMEEHKQRALVHFLKRCGKPLESLFQSMSEVEQDLRDSYNKSLFVWKEGNHLGKFSKILDGCFMLEVLRIGDCRVDYCADYVDNDPIFSDHGRLYVMPYIKRDMLMLENQLPMIVLDKLIEFEGRNTRDEEFLNKLILQFFFPGTPPSRSFGKCLHTLDLYRKALLQHSPSHHTVIPKPTKADKHRGYDDDIIIRSVVELRESGISFKLSVTPSLKDISFNNGILRLPSIIIDDYTESMFLNLMAFERLHVGAGNEVTSYIFFMDNIIHHDVDVAILHRKGIIVNALGSDKDVAKLFNTLARDVSVDRNNGAQNIRFELDYTVVLWHVHGLERNWCPRHGLLNNRIQPISLSYKATQLPYTRATAFCFPRHAFLFETVKPHDFFTVSTSSEMGMYALFAIKSSIIPTIMSESSLTWSFAIAVDAQLWGPPYLEIIHS